MNTERLLVLADYLEKLPEERFNISYWQMVACGSIACALGHACYIPAFQEAGLKLWQGVPRYKIDSGITAGASFFGISRNKASELFLSAGYPASTKITAKTVAEKIRRLVGN